MAAGEALRMKKPVHPGQFVRSIIMEPLGLLVTEAGKALSVTRVALSRLANGQASLSADMAIRLGKAFGADMDTLMRMQTSFDIARSREAEIRVQRFEPKVRSESVVTHRSYGSPGHQAVLSTCSMLYGQVSGNRASGRPVSSAASSRAPA